MKTLHRIIKRPMHAAWLVFGAALVPLLAAQGQPTVEPATQPTDTLAPYVLERTSLEPRPGTQEEGGTLAYRPWFENGAWTGDLIQYEITEDGLRVARDDIGRYPRDGQDWRGTNPLWSARYVFPDFEWYDEAQEFDPSWQCVEESLDYWQNRNIFTVYPGGTKIDFQWNSLSAEQQQAVDSATYDLQFTTGNEALQTEPYASPILSFLRGDRSNERCKQDGVYRWRFSLLGAIINSRPVYVPTTYIPLSGGTETVDGLVVVGANDGMLHGFSAADGTEQFAYIPSMLLDKLGALRISPYRPTYFVDGELRNANIGTSASPRHVVTGGLGAGGKGLFVLDVSNPVSPTVSLELAGDSGDHVDPATVDSRIGYVHGRPTIARIPDGTADGAWHVVTGNGYGSNSDVAQLVLIPLNADGSAGTPAFIPTDGTDNNGLSAPSLVDSDSNGTADVAYAGDLRGNLWRFDLETNTATKLFAAGANKPITVEPDVAVHPEAAQGFIVYFGTGSLLSGADAQSTDPQTMYGIWDRGDGLTVAANRLVTQQLRTRSQTWDVPQDQNLCGDTGLTTSDSTVRYIGNPQAPVWTGTNPNLGWQVALPRAGERLIGHPQIRAERVQFITTNPYDMADATRMNDADSGSWILQLDLASGANALSPRALFDLNKNCQLDLADGSPEGFTADGASISEGTFPVGVNLGPFNISQPAFARVLFNPDLKSVVDGVYINGLQLPATEPPEAMANGPLDVTTDSPSNSGVTEYRLDENGELLLEPTKSPFALRPFPEASGPTKPFLSADGLGKRVDGHSFGYLQHHGVDHVDFFDLEPRRGLSRLDVGATYVDENGNYLPIVFDTDADTGEQIQRVSKQELSKVTEVGIDEDDQKFIVVVANADLSRENEITIGCRTWPIYDYQTIVMDAIRSGDPVAALNAQNLVFTLDGIRSESGCTEPTLRITPTERIGAQDATMGTLPGCVNNTDLYEGPSRQEFLETRKDILAEDGSLPTGYSEADLYRIDPHTTPPPPVKNNQPQTTGYRWRNGALTVQLLAVNDDLSAAFEIQERDFLPEGPGIEGEDFGWGGAYAKAFDIQTEGNGNNAVDVVVPIEGDDNGLLYELSMFWHWGDMARFQSSGKGSPVVPICYGTTDYVPSIARETEWFTPGAYSQLTADFTGSEENEALQDEYASLIAQLQSGQENLDSAVQRLQEILTLHPDIADYHRLRHYVPNSKQLNENHLIRIDKSGQDIELAVDGTPVDVVDIERDLLPSLGPNYQLGRRSWIDLVPEE